MAANATLLPPDIVEFDKSDHDDGLVWVEAVYEEEIDEVAPSPLEPTEAMGLGGNAVPSASPIRRALPHSTPTPTQNHVLLL